MVWGLIRVALFLGSFFIGLLFFGPRKPSRAVTKVQPAITISHKRHKKPYVSFVADFSISGVRAGGGSGSPV